MEAAPFSLESLVRQYHTRRPVIQRAYQQMFELAHHLVNARRLQHTFAAAELPLLADCLPGAETLTLGLCTVGPRLEAEVVKLFEQDPMSAYALDEIGTRWVNELARGMHLEIRQTARAQGKQASPAYRPGIGRWPVELQDQIFEHLPAAEAGIELLEGMIMLPQKSISLIVAVGVKLKRHCYAPKVK